MQHTLQNSFSFSGVGVHSGQDTHVTVRPAPENTGIVYVRSDISGKNPVIPAMWDKVIDTKLCTVIANEDGVKVGTIEHLMAAIAASKIDNAIIEMDNEEMPIMDGSAKDFMALIEEAGIIQQNKTRRVIVITKDIHFTDEDKSASLKPARVPTYSFDIDFSQKSALIGKQHYSVKLTAGAFEEEISDARTFGLLEEVEYLKSIGLARGGSLENAVVVDGDKVLNSGGLRYKDEFVRHKILDSIGDIYLAGAEIIGHFVGVRAGHAVNNQMLHALFANPDCWRYEERRDVNPVAIMVHNKSETAHL